MPNLKNKKVIKDQQGQRKYPGRVTEIQGNTMATTGYGDIPLYVVPNVGNPMVVPADSGNRVFPGASSFTEYPIAKNSGWLDKYQYGGETLEDNDSWFENILEIADPTGISSWDDVYRAYKNKGIGEEVALELLGSIPLLGKVKKAGRLVDDLANAFAITKKQKNNAKIASGALKGIGKYGPSSGRVTDAVQAILGAKDDSGFTWDLRLGEVPKYGGRNLFPKIELGEHGDYAYGGWLDTYQDGGKTLEQKINKALGDPRKKAADAAINKKWFNKETKKWEVEDDTDNFRHPMAARYTAEAIANKFPDWMKYSGIPQVAGFVGSTALGVGHELANNKYTSNDPKDYPNYTFWDTVSEAGEDAFNNIVGAGVGVLPISDDKKTAYLKYLSDNNILPDGLANKKTNMYFKRNGGLIDTYGDNPKAQVGKALKEYENDKDPISHLKWGKYIDDPKRREQHIIDVYQYLMDSNWEPNSIVDFMKKNGSYGSKNRGNIAKKGADWGWDSEDINNEVLGKAWDDYYNNRTVYDKKEYGGWLDTYQVGGLKSVTGPAPKFDAKTEAESKRIASGYNNANKQNAQISQTRNWSQADQEHSDRVKARINNPASDIGILAANMASNLTRFRNLTPEEIARVTDNVGETVNLSSGIATDALTNELVGYGATKAIPFVSKSAKAAGKYLTEETALKNAYKLNPSAIKENPEMFLYRAEPSSFNSQSTIDFMKQQVAVGKEKPWYKATIKSYEEGHPKLMAQNDFHGQWLEKDPARLDWYLNSSDKVDAGTPMSIFRTKIPTSEATKYSVANNTKANVISASPNTEFVMPRNIIEQGEKFPESSWQQLIAEDKAFNTPHWSQGYKQVPKELSGSSNASSLLERINLERQGVKTKSNVIKENIQDGNFKITSRSTPNKGLVNVNIESPTGSIQATRNPDGSYGLSFEDANPFNAGKSMLKLKDQLAGKTIHETKSFSTDSYANILKLKKKLPFEEAGFLPLNSSNKINNFLDDLVIKNNNEWSASSKFKSEESAIEGAKRIDDYMLKLGETTKSKVVNNNGKFEVHVPNYKIKVPEVNNTFKTLQNKQDNGQWLNKYQDGGYVVNSGDNLSTIAKNNNTDIATLQSLNNIKDVNRISIGQNLILPKKQVSTSNTNVQAEQIKDLNSYSFSEAFKIARKQLGPNKIFEHNGKKFGTNLAGEKFVPDQEELAKNNMLNDAVVNHLNDQNKKVESIYTTKNTVKLQPTWKENTEIDAQNQEFNKLKNAELINKYQSLASPNEKYIIVDKKKGKMHVYLGGKEIDSYNVGTGENKGDEQTRTWVDKKTHKTDWSKGNKQTGAGIYTISFIDEHNKHYSNAPSFHLKNESGTEVPTAIHAGFGDRLRRIANNDVKNNDPKSGEDTRFSNGCINGLCKDMTDLYKNDLKQDRDKNTGTKVFILPDDDSNYFSVKNNKLNFTTSGKYNQTTAYSPKNLNASPIKIKVLNKDFETKEVKNMAKTLEDNKSQIMKDANIDNDTYNRLSKMAISLSLQETKGGTDYNIRINGHGIPGTNKEEQQGLVSGLKNVNSLLTKYKKDPMSSIEDFAAFSFFGTTPLITEKTSVNSKGMTQIKYDAQNKELVSQFKKYGITKDNLNQGKNAAIATVLMLSYMHNNELPSLKEKIKKMNISDEEALLYLNQGKKSEIVNGTATPKKNMYIKNIKKYSDQISLKQQSY